MFTVGCKVSDITVTAVKSYDDYVVYKMRAVAKRPSLAFENVYVCFKDDDMNKNYDMLIKMPSGRSLKQYLELEAKIMTLVDKHKFCSIGFMPAHGRVFQCNLSDSSKITSTSKNGYYDIGLRLLSCKCTKRTTHLTWELVNIQANTTHEDKVKGKLVGASFESSDSDSSDSDNGSNSDEDADADVGPSPEEVEEIRVDMVRKLECEIERLASIVSVSEGAIKTYTTFMNTLNASANAYANGLGRVCTSDNFILETVQKANLILELPEA